MFIHNDPATGLPVGTTAAFLTLGAALVALFPSPHERTVYDKPAFRWLCLGCASSAADRAERPAARDQANDHATTCRAIPLPRTDQS